jgi:hypothetical protein
MTGAGSGDKGQFTFMDVIGLMSFMIGIQNLDLNVTQEDAQNIQKELSDKSNLILAEIHAHLEAQDQKIDHILEVLKNGRNL